jgi:hypothetical protein
MAMKNLFLKSKFHPEKMTTISILSEKRKIAEEFCSGKKGVLLQDKSGEFYCIKGKSIVLLSE